MRKLQIGYFSVFAVLSGSIALMAQQKYYDLLYPTQVTMKATPSSAIMDVGEKSPIIIISNQSGHELKEVTQLEISTDNVGTTAHGKGALRYGEQRIVVAHNRIMGRVILLYSLKKGGNKRWECKVPLKPRVPMILTVNSDDAVTVNAPYDSAE